MCENKLNRPKLLWYPKRVASRILEPHLGSCLIILKS